MGALGPVLGDLGSLLGDLEAVLGRSWGVLGRSWGLLARSWAVLGGQEGQKSRGPGSHADQGREMLAPPRRKYVIWDPTPRVISTTSQGQGNEEKRTYGTWRALWNMNRNPVENQENRNPVEKQETRDHGEDHQRDPAHAQRPRGPADIELVAIYSY